MYKVTIHWETGDKSAFEFPSLKEANNFALDQRELFPGLTVTVESING